MRIISLHPLATDILDYCGVGWNLVGVTHVCAKPTNATKASVVTTGPSRPFQYLNKHYHRLAEGLCEYPLNIEELKECVPNIILADVREPDSKKFIKWAEELLFKRTGTKITIKQLKTDTLEDVYQTMIEVGDLIGKRSMMTRLVEDIRTQLNEWAENYCLKCKGKKVLLLSETDPFEFESGWVDDLISLFGAHTFSKVHAHHSVPISWKDIVEGRPDVIVVAPHNTFLKQSVRRLQILEASEGWGNLPAVQGGQVFFTAGMDIYRPGPNFLRGVAAFVTAMAGLDKPILKDQEDFVKIRRTEAKTS